jgi:nicotinate dehydrogenase subunit B
VRIVDAPFEAEENAGEFAQGPVAGVIGNAVADAVGVRLRDMPLTRERAAEAIDELAARVVDRTSSGHA